MKHETSQIAQAVMVFIVIVAVVGLLTDCEVRTRADANAARIQCVKAGRPIAECTLLFGGRQ